MDINEWIERDKKLKENGILAETMFTKILKTDYYINAYQKIIENIINRPQNSFSELTTYRRYVPELLSFIEALSAEFSRIEEMTWRFLEENKGNKNKKWSEYEDNTLIEAICSDIPINNISLMMGRTVASIKTRVSYLVGVKRLTQKVAGKFIGEINGEQTEAELSGTIYKE